MRCGTNNQFNSAIRPCADSAIQFGNGLGSVKSENCQNEETNLSAFPCLIAESAHCRIAELEFYAISPRLE